MKNRKHSELVHELNRLRKSYNHYLICIVISKENLLMSPYERDYINELSMELKDWRYIVANIRTEIKKIKNKIYEVQRDYSINHANQQPSQPLTKLEGSETNIWN